MDNFIFFVLFLMRPSSEALLLSLSVNSRSAFSNVRLLHTLKFASGGGRIHNATSRRFIVNQVINLGKGAIAPPFCVQTPKALFFIASSAGNKGIANARAELCWRNGFSSAVKKEPSASFYGPHGIMVFFLYPRICCCCSCCEGHPTHPSSLNDH